MNLAKIKAAIKELSPAEMVELAGFVHEMDNAAWNNEIEAAIDRGLSDLANGRVRSIEQVKDLLPRWISKP